MSVADVYQISTSSAILRSRIHAPPQPPVHPIHTDSNEHQRIQDMYDILEREDASITRADGSEPIQSLQLSMVA